MKTKINIIPGKLYRLTIQLGWEHLQTHSFKERLRELGDDVYDISIKPGVYLVTSFVERSDGNPYHTVNLLIGCKEVSFFLLTKEVKNWFKKIP